MRTLVFLGSLICGFAFELTVTAFYPNLSLSLYLRGNDCGLNWESGTPMISSGADSWTAQVQCENNATYVEMKVLVSDRDWMLGCNHFVDLSASNNSTIYPWFYTFKGELKIINDVYSEELGNDRDVIIYTPPSFFENTLKVYKNVLIMHDGQNLFDPHTSVSGTAWMCQDTLDTTIISGTTEEVVVLGPYYTADRMNEYTYTYDEDYEAGGKGELYLDWLESTLIPLASTSWFTSSRIAIGRNSLGILGASLGGLISCYAGWTRSNVYGKVGCMSPSMFWANNDYQKNVMTAAPPTTAPAVPVVYMDAGTEEGGEAQIAQDSQDAYEYEISNQNGGCGCGFEADINAFMYIEPLANHSEYSWGCRYHIAVQALYPPLSLHL